MTTTKTVFLISLIIYIAIALVLATEVQRLKSKNNELEQKQGLDHEALVSCLANKKI